MGLNQIDKGCNPGRQSIIGAMLGLGSEARGISKITKDMADLSIIIPLKNQIESLNVATSHAIILYALEGK